MAVLHGIGKNFFFLFFHVKLCLFEYNILSITIGLNGKLSALQYIFDLLANAHFDGKGNKELIIHKKAYLYGNGRIIFDNSRKNIANARNIYIKLLICTIKYYRSVVCVVNNTVGRFERRSFGQVFFHMCIRR